MSIAPKPDHITGRTYLERGLPVRVLVRWGGHIAAATSPSWIDASAIEARSGPRNVLIQRADGTRLVRPFRGLRRTTGGAP